MIVGRQFMNQQHLVGVSFGGFYVYTHKETPNKHPSPAWKYFPCGAKSNAERRCTCCTSQSSEWASWPAAVVKRGLWRWRNGGQLRKTQKNAENMEKTWKNGRGEILGFGRGILQSPLFNLDLLKNPRILENMLKK